MKRLPFGKWIGVLLAACMLSGLLTGCVKSGDGEGALGRFAEKQLAELPHIDHLLSAARSPEGDLVFYGFGVEEEQVVVTRNLLPKGGGALQTTQMEWVNALLTGHSTAIGFDEAADGTAYLLYSDESRANQLARHRDGVTDHLELEGWNQGGSGNATNFVQGGSHEASGEEEENAVEAKVGGFGSVNVYDDSALFPSGINALEDGEFLVAYSGKGVYHYNAGGETLREYPGMSYGGGIAVQGDCLALADMEREEVILYRPSSGEVISRTPLAKMPFDLCIGLDGEALYFADQNGIAKLNASGREMMVDGGLTSLMLPTYSIDRLLVGEGQEYYCFLRDEEGIDLMRYYFDDTLPASPDTELNIFSLYENNTIRQAIGAFQRENPNVRVNLNVALTEGGSATAEDVIRALNTEMLGGNSPDLIVMDGLPIASYIEKGVLEDLTQLVTRLSASEGLMENLMEAFRYEGKIYGLPSRFSLPVMVGDAKTLDRIRSLGDLAELADQEQGNQPALLPTPNELWDEELGGMLMKYYDACAHSFVKEDGSLNQAALEAFLTDMLRLDEALKEHSPQVGDGSSAISIAVSGGGRGYEVLDIGSWDLRDGKALAHLQTLGGMMSLRSIGGDLGEKPGFALQSMFGENLYYPMGGIGITAAGKQKELATDFVETLLSGAVQSKYLYDGFPVNGPSLDQMIEEQLRGELFDDGEEPVSEMGFRALCNDLRQAVLIDDVVKAAVEEQAKGLLDGAVSAQEAAARIVERTRLYLAE